jgi:hypothetical protein
MRDKPEKRSIKLAEKLRSKFVSCRIEVQKSSAAIHVDIYGVLHGEKRKKWYWWH